MLIPAHVRIPAIYLVVSGLWIYCSDHAVEMLFSDPRALVVASMCKGWFFVVVTAVLLWGMIRTALKAQLEAERQKQAFLAANVLAMNHITRNFLNKMTIFREYAERTEGFDRDILKLYDQIITEADQEIARLSQVKDLDPSGIARAITPTKG